MFEHFTSWFKNKNGLTEQDKSVKTSAGLLLAAGLGRRFDQSGKKNKLLAKYRDASVIGCSALSLSKAVENRIAVIRPGEAELGHQLKQFGFQIVECPDATSGMGHSLSWGVAHAMKTFDMQILVVALADMPSVKSETIQHLLAQAHTTGDIVAPIYQGKRGNPVVFQTMHFEKLSRLNGDRGASQFLKNEKVILLEVDDPGIHKDIDSPEDLNNG
jgi:molybdenum cofactor cytidylyltransferase